MATCGKQSGKPTSVTQSSGTGNEHVTLSGVDAGNNRRQAVVAGTGADGRTGESMAPNQGSDHYGMYVIEALNQTKTEFFRDGMPRRIEFTLSSNEWMNPVRYVR
ncbi:phage tail protein [Escherichia coli]